MALARAVNWKVLFGLNLPHSSAATDAQEASYVSQSGAGPLFGFEIGNEPDLYASNGNESANFNLTQFLSAWNTYASAISSADPAAVLAGPATSDNIGTWTTLFASTFASKIGLLTHHFYPLGPVSSVGVNSPNACTIANLLDGATHAKAAIEAAQLANIAKSAKLPWRMAETNSCYNGGTTGVSDTFASALWGLDYMFTLASNSAAGVNFHGGGTGPYTVIATNSSSVTPRPLYYALLMFEAAASGNIVPLTVSAGGINVNAYATLGADGALRVIVLNEDPSFDATVNITPGAAYTRALAMTFTATALNSGAGVGLGGSAVAADGSWSPAQFTAPRAANGVYSMPVPSGSAVVVAFGASGLGIGNSAGGAPQIAPDSLASAYGQALGFATRNTASTTLPTTIAGVQVTLTDAAGVTRPVPLIYVSPNQVNFQTPSGTAPGQATLNINGATGTVMVNNAAPGLFTIGGSNVAAATALRDPVNGGLITPVSVFNCGSGTCTAVPILVSSQSTVYLSLYATGIRNAVAGSGVSCTIGGVGARVQYAGPQPQYPGLDQINVAIPISLNGAGTVPVQIAVNGVASNPVNITIQ
jgi:uncharacterized protein (TIGR03437 family)